MDESDFSFEKLENIIFMIIFYLNFRDVSSIPYMLESCKLTLPKKEVSFVSISFPNSYYEVGWLSGSVILLKSVNWHCFFITFAQWISRVGSNFILNVLTYYLVDSRD